MARGYMGQFLNVDLSTGKIESEPLDEKLCRDFIGGYGIVARLLFDRMPARADALGPQNILAFFTGPFTGTPAISGTRFTVAAKSPLTGGWGDANSGGSFAAFLKFAGFDGILVSGISKNPVYLFIDNGKAELRDASALWGKDTYDTDDMLKAEFGKSTSIACIGESGEKLSLVSGIVHNKGSVAARSGLGAVMGSKKLKAVAVRGSMKVPIADEAWTKKMRKEYIDRMGGDLNNMQLFGTTFTTLPSIQSGDAPVKNYKGVGVRDFPTMENLGGDALNERKWKRNACYQCPVGCEAVLKEGTGEYKYIAGTFRPEYETIAMLGSNCLNDNLESVIKANDVCNRHGIDTISMGSIISFAMECWEKGILTKEDTDGLDLTWGNHQTVVELCDRIARRQGFGDILADGVKIASEKIGKGSEQYAMHVQGQEIPGHNPIATPGQGTTYLSNATPARHTQGSEAHQPAGLLPEFDRSDPESYAVAYRLGSCFQHILFTTGMCLFVNMVLPNVQAITDFMKSVTGWDVTTEELVETGERIAAMRQAFNIREGLLQDQRTISGRLYGDPPHDAGPLTGVKLDVHRNVREYLKLMKWDTETGIPARERLVELGLGDVAEVIYK